MPKQRIKHVTVVGVGLLGGSAALAIKARDSRVKVAGVGRRESSLRRALEVGAIDTAHLDAAEAVAGTDLVILATPVGAFAKHMRAMAPVLRRGAVVTDVGSTKTGVVRTGERILGPGGPFVGSHPMAGSERKGVAFARGDLFVGATCVVTPTPRTPRNLAARVERFWQTLGMRTVEMSPGAHDRAVARVSHLPHVLASLLMMLPGEKDLDVSATGFRAATRLASGDPEMWRDVLTTNRKAIASAMDALGARMAWLRKLLEDNDAEEIEAFLSSAKRRRDGTVARVGRKPRVSAK